MACKGCHYLPRVECFPSPGGGRQIKQRCGKVWLKLQALLLRFKNSIGCSDKINRAGMTNYLELQKLPSCEKSQLQAVDTEQRKEFCN